MSTKSSTQKICGEGYAAYPAQCKDQGPTLFSYSQKDLPYSAALTQIISTYYIFERS